MSLITEQIHLLKSFSLCFVMAIMLPGCQSTQKSEYSEPDLTQLTQDTLTLSRSQHNLNPYFLYAQDHDCHSMITTSHQWREYKSGEWIHQHLKTKLNTTKTWVNKYIKNPQERADLLRAHLISIICGTCGTTCRNIKSNKA